MVALWFMPPAGDHGGPKVGTVGMPAAGRFEAKIVDGNGGECLPGGRGEIVKVKAGYARNYLLPRGIASLATKGNVKQIEGEQYRVSMRSKGDTDISAIAKKFGGGGHKNAAGCTVTGVIDFEWALAGDPAWDFIAQDKWEEMCPGSRAYLYAGYTHHRPLAPDHALRVAIYQLLLHVETVVDEARKENMSGVAAARDAMYATLMFLERA